MDALSPLRQEDRVLPRAAADLQDGIKTLIRKLFLQNLFIEIARQVPIRVIGLRPFVVCLLNAYRHISNLQGNEWNYIHIPNESHHSITSLISRVAMLTRKLASLIHRIASLIITKC